jgi:hypothetical protein
MKDKERKDMARFVLQGGYEGQIEQENDQNCLS